MKYKITIIIETLDKYTFLPTKEVLTEVFEENLLYYEETISSIEIEKLKD